MLREGAEFDETRDRCSERESMRFNYKQRHFKSMGHSTCLGKRYLELTSKCGHLDTYLEQRTSSLTRMDLGEGRRYDLHSLNTLKTT